MKAEVEITEIMTVSPAQASVELTSTGYVVAQSVSKAAPKVPGKVLKAYVREGSQVKAGDVLFEVDPAPYRIALDQANAAVEAARLSVEQLRAAYSQAVAQERVTAGEVTYQQSVYDRQLALSGKGIATQSALDEARRDLQKAQDEEAAAQQGIISARAALGGNPDIAADKHPTVLAALAAQEKAAYELGLTTVKAPSDGVIYQASSFKPGQYVTVGAALFTLVETGDTWVAANFKETQLTNIKPGQDAEVEVDTYPGKKFAAKVEAIGAGTGAEFSLLPAQNATGNWVKVTQRIPVRLKLDDKTAPDLMLRTGMSASVTVDTGATRGFGSLLSMGGAEK
jgi:membrane fusion protein (multidrug efflux system)